LRACLGHGLLRALKHLRSEIYSDHSTLWSHLASSQDDVYPPAATEVHDHLSGLKVCKPCGIAATP